MSEETKQPAEETPEEPQEAPQEEAPPAEEKVPDEKAEKAARGKKKKEKTYTLTREQMEAAELAARQLESVKDPADGRVRQLPQAHREGERQSLPGRQGGHHQGVPGGVRQPGAGCGH